MIKASKAMVECLKAENIKVVFGYPGAAICPFYDSLSNSDIKHVLVRHEANGGHSANGYARITGKPAVCIATSGPGATNLITGIATAYMDSIPLVAITGQVHTDQIGSDAFQEADITGAVEPFIKHSYLVRDAKKLPQIFKEAFYIAGSGRPGPVLIDVPVDVQNTLIDFEYPTTVDIRSYKPTIKGNPMQIKRVFKAIEQAKKPLICVGGGVFNANAVDEMIKLAELCNIPVITTMMGISAMPTNHPLYFGMIGMHGSSAANQAINKCDELFLIGARVGDRAVISPSFLQNNTKIIHIDVDPAEIGKNVNADIPLVGDAKVIINQLLEIAHPVEHTEWLQELNALRKDKEYAAYEDGTVNPKRFLTKLFEAMPRDGVVVADVGQNQIWSASCYKVDNGRFLTTGGMGTMGYSVPAAIGAKLADSTREVVAICGDGSFQMQMMELATAVQEDVRIKIIVIKNNRLGMVREVQTKVYNDNQTAVFLDGSPDFIKLAEAYGIKTFRVNGEQDIDGAIDFIVNYNGLALVEVSVSPDESTL